MNDNCHLIGVKTYFTLPIFNRIFITFVATSSGGLSFESSPEHKQKFVWANAETLLL